MSPLLLGSGHDLRRVLPRAGPEEQNGTTIAYLTKAFPRWSETFILDEILGLERDGVPLRLYAVFPPGETLTQPDVDLVASPVVYLRGSVSRLGTLAAHLRLAFGHPLRYQRALDALLRGADRRTAWRHFVMAGRFADHLRHDRARHIHAAFAHTPASVARYASLLTDLPFSFAAHAKDIYRSNPHNLAIRAGEAKMVLVCSACAAKELSVRAGPGANIVLAYHGVDSVRFRPAALARAADGDGRPLGVLAVGRLVAKKGYTVLLEALSMVAMSGRSLRCEIIGSGEMEAQLRRRSANLGLDDVVSFVGERTHQELPGAYGAADVFVQPSVVLADGDRDGIPNALLEAMASGLAVVVSDVGGITEAVTDETTGIVVPPEDAHALALALTRLIDDCELRGRLGVAARAYVAEHLDRGTCVSVTADLLLSRPPIDALISRVDQT